MVCQLQFWIKYNLIFLNILKIINFFYPLFLLIKNNLFDINIFHKIDFELKFCILCNHSSIYIHLHKVNLFSNILRY